MHEDDFKSEVIRITLLASGAGRCLGDVSKRRLGKAVSIPSLVLALRASKYRLFTPLMIGRDRWGEFHVSKISQAS